MKGLQVRNMDIFTGVPKDILIPQWVYKMWKQCYISATLQLQLFLSYPIWWFVINSAIFISGIFVHTIFCSFWRPVPCFRIRLELLIKWRLWLWSPPNAAWKWASWAFLSWKICVESKYFCRRFTHRTKRPDVVLVMEIPVYSIGVWVVTRVCTRDALSGGLHSDLPLLLGLNQVMLCVGVCVCRYPLSNLEQVKTQFVLPFPGLDLSKYCLDVSIIP